MSITTDNHKRKTANQRPAMRFIPQELLSSLVEVRELFDEGMESLTRDMQGGAVVDAGCFTVELHEGEARIILAPRQKPENVKAGRSKRSAAPGIRVHSSGFGII